MGVDVTTEIVIHRPVERVAAYAGDPSNAPEWYVNIRSIDWKTSPPAAVGSQMDFVAHFLGKRMAYTYEITELISGERLVMRTVDGPFPMETSYRWKSLSDDTTHMTLRNRGEPRGFSKLVSPIMAAAMRRANEKDLARLRRLLEGS